MTVAVAVVGPRSTSNFRCALSRSHAAVQPMRTAPGPIGVAVGVSSLKLWIASTLGDTERLANRTRPCWFTPLTRGNSPPSTV